MARRTAERAARELIRSRAADIGDLGVAKSTVELAVAAVESARAEAREIVAAAEARAKQLFTDRGGAVEEATVSYTRAYLSAVEHGWRPEELQGMGFRPPTNAMKSEVRRRDDAEAQPAAASGPGSATEADECDKELLPVRPDGDDRATETA